MFVDRIKDNWLKIALSGVASILVLSVGCASIEIVPAGYVAVSRTFGKVSDTVGKPGINIGNPFTQWQLVDCRGRSYDQAQTPIPSQDAQTTKIDFSIQYRFDCSMAVEIVRDIGGPASLLKIHMVPFFRSLVREKGKSVARAQDYFLETIQSKIQTEVLAELQEKVVEKGVIVTDILLRNVALPLVVQNAVNEKTVRQQEAEKQEAELARFEIEQQQMVKTAEAENEAAGLEAQRILTLAHAQAEANSVLRQSLTAELVRLREIEVRQMAVEKWDGKLPHVAGGAIPLIEIGD